MNSTPRTVLRVLLAAAGCVVLAYGFHRCLNQEPVFARISVERTRAKAPGGGPATLIEDPSFTRMEMEFMRSEIVLDKVIRALGLERQWGSNSPAEDARRTNAALRRLRQHVKLVQVPKTGLVDIQVTGEPPPEAARIANAIAEVCLLHYREQYEQTVQSLSSSISNSVATLDEQWSSLGEQIHDVRVQLARFKPEPTLSDPGSNDAANPAVLQASNALQVKLEGLQRTRAELEQRFIADTPVAPVLECVTAELVRAAAAPSRRSKAARFVDAGVFAAGLVLCLAGWWVTRPRRTRSPRPAS